LREDRVDQCQHDLALAFAGEGQRVANEVHTASLPRRLEDFGHGSFEAQVRIGDDQPNATQSAARQRAQERRPEGLGFAWTNGNAQDFPYAISVYADGYLLQRPRRFGRPDAPSRTLHRSTGTANRLQWGDRETR